MVIFLSYLHTNATNVVLYFFYLLVMSDVIGLLTTILATTTTLPETVAMTSIE